MPVPFTTAFTAAGAAFMMASMSCYAEQAPVAKTNGETQDTRADCHGAIVPMAAVPHPETTNE